MKFPSVSSAVQAVALVCFLGEARAQNSSISDANTTTTSSNTLTLIHINDHHSHFFEASLDLSGESVPPGLSVETDDLRMFHGGAARVSATIQAMKAAGIDMADVCYSADSNQTYRGMACGGNPRKLADLSQGMPENRRTPDSAWLALKQGLSLLRHLTGQAIRHGNAA